MKGKPNMKKNLLDLDLQHFAEEEVADAEVSEAVEPTEEPEAEETETGESDGDSEPQEQSAEDNARYAAIRRRAEDEARRKYEHLAEVQNQQIAAMCEGITHPKTGQPITNVNDYIDALRTQQQMAQEQELRDKGIDPSIIDKAIAQNPLVMQAQQVIEQSKKQSAEQALQNDLAEIGKLDPNIKNINDLSALPDFPEILDRVERGASLLDAYKIVNFGKTTDAARQQAINQMRGKSHLASQPNGVSTDNDDVEVPAEIMSSWKAEGKTEKQIRELYKTVAKKLNLN
jgi:transcriptional regulator of met regulon